MANEHHGDVMRPHEFEHADRRIRQTRDKDEPARLHPRRHRTGLRKVQELRHPLGVERPGNARVEHLADKTADRTLFARTHQSVGNLVDQSELLRKLGDYVK